MENEYAISSVRLFLAALLVGGLSYVGVHAVKFFNDIRRRMKFLSKLPQVKSHWLFGYAYELPGPGEAGIEWMKKRFYSNPEGYGLEWYGPFVPAVSTYQPNSVKMILKTSEPKPQRLTGSAYSGILPWLGDGLLLAGGPKWARNRRLLTPAFHFEILRPYMTVNNRATDIFLSKLDKYAAKGEFFEVINNVSLLTLDIILRCAFSYDIDCQRQGDENGYVKAIRELSEALFYRMTRPWLYPDIIFYLTAGGRQFKKNCDYVHNIAEDIIKKRKETRKTQGLEAAKKSRYLDFLDILLTAKDDSEHGLSDREIRDEVDTFLFEGHDTTASGISWALYSLAKHPEHQERCQQEIDELLAGKENKDIEWDDLPKLNYLTMCLKESLRMHTPVPFIQRHTTKDLEIEGCRIPAGTLVDIHLHILHNNPLVWENPEEYRPDRFGSEKQGDADHYAFLPFSAGPRNCIGQHFAMHEMKTIIAKTLSRFTLTLDPVRKTEHRIAVVMKSEDGIYVKATPREAKAI